MARVKKDHKFLVVGIGASAGGLRALEKFFTPIPPNCGAGFIVIQHIDPNLPSMLSNLLQRVTSMKVAEAREGIMVKANCIYVIPPNKVLTIVQGRLHLTKPIAQHGFRLPINDFFQSLAEDTHNRAVGVILSGMGSDGTLGLKAIKENGGITAVQLPETATSDAMPHSAINAGVAEIVATPELLWQHITNALQQPLSSLKGFSEPLLETIQPTSLDKILDLLNKQSGNDFSLYKKNTLYRRIERRMDLHQFDSINHYIYYLEENPQEIDLLFKELLIGVTRFFRDETVWEKLMHEAIPALLAEYPNGKEMRAWVPACSTGEEAYSLAIAFKETLRTMALDHDFQLQIFATDLDADGIQKARKGYYPINISADISPELLRRYFVQETNGYQIKKEIREMIIFAQQNVTMEPPFTKLDLLLCRNLLIYLEPTTQKKLIRLFHYALTSTGLLVLGNAETIGNFSDLFTTIDNTLRIYRRIPFIPTIKNFDFPTQIFPIANMTSSDKTTNKPIVNIQQVVEQLLLSQYSPSAVMVNADGDILYIHGRTGKYLEPAAGKANLNIYAMARDGLRLELLSAIKQAQQQKDAVFMPNLTVGSYGNSQILNLSVQAIVDPDELKGTFLVIFTDVTSPKIRKRTHHYGNTELQVLQDELHQTREQMQIAREEMQTSQEELKSTNEELQSTNEELQSSNEELVTSKEEMQSLNEELQTVNAELQAKVNDLSWVNNDMKNLLNSMEIATVFLDDALHIRRFTTHATKIFKLIPGDSGRPLSDIVNNLDYPQLLEDAKSVLQTLVYIEKQVKTHDGLWFKIRILPYRTQENVIDGVVITFTDITETKMLEAKLRGE